MDYLGVDARVVLLSASVSPGHNTLQLTIAHHGATRVTLETRTVFIVECLAKFK